MRLCGAAAGNRGHRYIGKVCCLLLVRAEYDVSATPTLSYVPATLMLSFSTKKLSIGANEDAASPFKFQVAAAHGIGHGSLELSS